MTWNIFTLLYYIPVLLSLYIVVTRYKKIYWPWFVLLGLSIVLGAAPLVSLIFLASHRNMLKTEAQPAPIEPSVQVNSPLPVYPSVFQILNPAAISQSDINSASNLDNKSVQQISVSNTKKAASGLGIIVSIILWVSGLITVGIFVLFAAVTISCAGNSKCM